MPVDVNEKAGRHKATIIEIRRLILVDSSP